mgnify:CR=1 FL=1
MSGTAIELFCGMGGATEGLRRAGVRVMVAVDGWRNAIAVHRRWHPDVPVALARCEHPPVNGVAPWLLWASPSCKPWSTANRTPKRGTAHPEYYSLARLVEQKQAMGARWLVVENVGGLVWSKEGAGGAECYARQREDKHTGRLIGVGQRLRWGGELGELAAACARLDERMTVSIVNSNTCGVAQIRRRVFIVVGPEYVKIPHGNDYIPPENAEVATLARDRHPLGKPGWRDGGARRGQAIMACEGSKGSWERETRWPKAQYAVGQSAWSSASLGSGAHGSDWGAAKARAARGVVANEHGLARSRQTRIAWGERQAVIASENRHTFAQIAVRSEAQTTLSCDGREAGRGTRNGRRTRSDADRYRSIGTHALMTNGRAGARDQLARTLAECCELQGVPLAVVAGLPKRVAHELVGNVAPTLLVEHVVRTLLREDQPCLDARAQAREGQGDAVKERGDASLYAIVCLVAVFCAVLVLGMVRSCDEPRAQVARAASVAPSAGIPEAVGVDAQAAEPTVCLDVPDACANERGAVAARRRDVDAVTAPMETK